MGTNLVTTALARRSEEYALLVQKPSRRKRKTPRKQFQRAKERLDITRFANETDKEFEKRKNACYARRNYHRKRMETFAAEGEIERYKTENRLLKQDNARLENLIATAKRLVQNTGVIPSASDNVATASAAPFANTVESGGFQWEPILPL